MAGQFHRTQTEAKIPQSDTLAQLSGATVFGRGSAIPGQRRDVVSLAGEGGLEAGDVEHQPVRAKDSSLWREPWEESERNQPRNRAIEGIYFAESSSCFIFRPVPGLISITSDPSTRVLGYFLPPRSGAWLSSAPGSRG